MEAPLVRRPAWLKVRIGAGENFRELKQLMRDLDLHTVCEEAHCPNIGECWGHRTATFMILGRVCTRACAYCAVETGLPQGLDLFEPQRVALAVKKMGLRHAVITSVQRDDLPDGGASLFAATVRRIRALNPGCTIELLIPDFKGSAEALATVLEELPDILNHNIETVPRLFKRARPGGRYARSLQLLARSKEIAPSVPTKSGLMVGLGETIEEVRQTLRDLRAVGVDIVTIGQYLRPSPQHLPVDRYVHPDEFAELKEYALSLGFAHCESGPLVRSSYHAHEQAQRADLLPSR
ncbi:MAG: lipoyl synthase [Chloroflexota bacterium]|nr:lipoyl synthase [Dehalococcoidia bacterium]MDW8253269.1 lipoyl synthase [Chloroflexota bacterium]